MIPCGTSRSSATQPSRSVVEAMSSSGFYPGHPPVTVRETHAAIVFLAGYRAYKLKKPVRMEFLDYRTLEQRRQACMEELRVNRELSPGLGLRLRAVVALSDSYVLVGAPDARAVEYVIEMRRFDEDRTMAALAERGELTRDHVHAVAQRLAAFHATGEPLHPADHQADVKRAAGRNARELLAVADDATALRVLAAERFAGAFLLAHRREIAARAADGRVRDCHGDLRAEHVVLEDPILVVDRLEFDPALRAIDVADDLAFLVMDLERLGAGDAARLLVKAYRAAGGDPGSDELLAYYGSYRALVRAKVAMLRASQLSDPADAAAARDEADELLGLAERLAWRARGPVVLAVSGPPASGKSTLAAAIGDRTGWPVLSSDVARKRAKGLALAQALPEAEYELPARQAIYRELGERAAAGIAHGHGVIVDATFGEPGMRSAFLDGRGLDPRLRVLECRAPARLRKRWAQERTAATAGGSDARPVVAARLASRFSSWDELPEDVILTLRSGLDAATLVDQVADWLDMRACVDATSGQRRAKRGEIGAAAP